MEILYYTCIAIVEIITVTKNVIYRIFIKLSRKCNGQTNRKLAMGGTLHKFLNSREDT